MSSGNQTDFLSTIFTSAIAVSIRNSQGVSPLTTTNVFVKEVPTISYESNPELAQGIVSAFEAIFGTIANILAIVITIKSNAYKVFRYMVISLATADGLFAFVVCGSYAIESFENNFILGDAGCKIVAYLRSMTNQASNLTLLVIASEKYMVIVKNNRSILTLTRTVILLGLMWVWSISWHCYWLMWGKVEDAVLVPGRRHCTLPDMWVNVTSKLGIIGLVWGFFTPLALTWTVHTVILMHVKSSSRRVATVVSAVQKDTWRVARVCLLIVIGFTITWLPYQIFNLVVGIRHEPGSDSEYTRKVLFNILCIDCCANPIIYSVAWRQFRFRKWRAICKCDFIQNHVTSSTYVKD